MMNVELNILVRALNAIRNRPLKQYIKEGGRYIEQIGNYHIESAYGKVKLCEVVQDGGVRSVTPFLTKKEVGIFIQGMLEQ